MSVRDISQPSPFDVLECDGAPAAASASGRLSLRSNFVWAVSGNAAFAACQWGMIVALAKFGNAFMVGQFSLGLAIVTPVFMFANLDLRNVQATDARRQYFFSEYLGLRLRSTITALAVIAGIVWFGRYGPGTAAVILAVALLKAVETLSDIHYGLFQLNDRLDQTGASMILRGVLSVTALSAGIYLARSVFWGCILVAVAWAGALLLFDFRRGRKLVASTEAAPSRVRAGFRHGRLLSVALPLGLVTALASINLHMPRYFVDAHMGERELGIFSAMAYATVVLTLVGDSLGASAIPRLSRFYASGDLARYRALLLRLLAGGSVIALSGLAIARSCGAWLLKMVYNADYAAQSRVFTLLMAGAALHFAASMLTSGITSARCFVIQVPLYLLVAGATALGCARWTPALGLTGAAFGVICGAAVRLALAGVIVAYLLLSKSSEVSAA